MNNNLVVVASNENDDVVTVEETINAIKQAGFENVFVQWYDNEYEFSQLQQVQLCKKLGLNIEFAHLGYQNLNSIWKTDGEYFVDRYKKNILDCHNLGIDMVVLHAITKWDPPEPNEIGLNRFKRIVEYAETLGVKVALENTKITDHIAYLMENIKSDYLGVCFDAGHFHCNSKDKWDVSKYKDKIFCVHLHDNDGNSDQHLLPFDGNMNWNTIINILDDLNYVGPITMELCYRRDYLDMSIVDFYKEGYRRGLLLKKLKNKEISKVDDALLLKK